MPQAGTTAQRRDFSQAQETVRPRLSCPMLYMPLCNVDAFSRLLIAETRLFERAGRSICAYMYAPCQS